MHCGMFTGVAHTLFVRLIAYPTTPHPHPQITMIITTLKPLKSWLFIFTTAYQSINQFFCVCVFFIKYYSTEWKQKTLSHIIFFSFFDFCLKGMPGLDIKYLVYMPIGHEFLKMCALQKFSCACACVSHSTTLPVSLFKTQSQWRHLRVPITAIFPCVKSYDNKNRTTR